MKSITTLVFKWLLVTSLLSFGFALAQTEPTLNQVYAATQAGKLDQAQLMIQQVLISHPNSGKAFFVQSELYARQGDLARSRNALASAERLAPGLPFAKAASVQALRAQLAAKNYTSSHSVAPMTARPESNSSSWALPLLLSVGVIGLGYFLFRKKKPDTFMPQSGYVPQNDLNGPQTFGTNTSSPYGQSTYPNQQPTYGQPTGSGLGGRIMGGVATGLAVGAGFMAAEAIGKSLMGGGHNALSPVGNIDSITNNPDMGGQNFGISDTTSWDDGAGIDVGGGGDWDN